MQLTSGCPRGGDPLVEPPPGLGEGGFDEVADEQGGGPLQLGVRMAGVQQYVFQLLQLS